MNHREKESIWMNIYDRFWKYSSFPSLIKQFLNQNSNKILSIGKTTLVGLFNQNKVAHLKQEGGPLDAFEMGKSLIKIGGGITDATNLPIKSIISTNP